MLALAAVHAPPSSVPRTEGGTECVHAADWDIRSEEEVYQPTTADATASMPASDSTVHSRNCTDRPSNSTPPPH